MSEREFALRTMKSGVLMYTHAPHPVQASSNHVGFAARAPLGEPDTRFFLGQIVGKVRMVRPGAKAGVNECVRICMFAIVWEVEREPS